MKKAAKLLGVQLNAAPHSARKTYAVEIFKDKGIDATQRELQHDRVSTTMLYAFSNILTKNEEIGQNTFDIDALAEKIARKVVEFLSK